MESTAPVTAPGPTRPAAADDAKLLARFQAGDAAAFDELVLAHQERVARLVHRLLGRIDEVDDVVQEVFLSVLQNLSRFRRECKFSTWLTTITVNKCRSHGRWRLRRLRLFARHGAAALPAVVQKPAPAEAEQSAAAVYHAVSRLPAKYREPIVLRYFQECSIDEIGAVLGVSANAVEVRLSRARQRLKRLLSRELRA